jgi:putative hydrolase of the HAD superfamily
MTLSNDILKNIKHLSFDLWLTLIKSNPDFKKQRALYFFNNLNTLKKSIEEVELTFREVDVMCNVLNEKTGNNISAEEMHLMVVYKLNNSLMPFEKIDLRSLYQEMEQLVFKNMPIVIEPTIFHFLGNIKKSRNLTINILSNTAFIKGSTLRLVLDHLDISRYFDFQIYSDEVSASKPSIKIYDILFQNISVIRNGENVRLEEILHVGDNLKADVLGAQACGINAFHVCSNSPLKSLFN